MDQNYDMTLGETRPSPLRGYTYDGADVIHVLLGYSMLIAPMLMFGVMYYAATLL